jgi:RNA polymerase sigma-70 factor, ECF subfamily
MVGRVMTDEQAGTGAPDAARDAALRLFQEHGAAVYRFASTLVRHRADAEDVVQETFLKLLRHLESGGNRSNLRGWLFTVAAHACRDRQRRRRRWLPWPAGFEPAVDPDPLDDEDGRIGAAHRALAALGARDRLLLTLRAQGLSYREISDASGISAASVGRLLARALERWARGCRRALPMSEACRRPIP